VRCFDDPNIVHVSGKVDPVSDIEVINTELALADLQTVDKQLAKYSKVAKTGQDLRPRKPSDWSTCSRRSAGAEPGPAGAQREPLSGRARGAEAAVPADGQADDVRGQCRGARLREQSAARSVREFAAREGAPVVAVCAKVEAEIADLSDEDKSVFLEDMGMHEPGLNA